MPFIILCLLSADLAALSFIDAKTRRIPNACILVGLTLWLMALSLPSTTSKLALTRSGLTGLVLLAGISLLCAALVKRLSGGEPLGMGDVKLYALAGLYLGPASGLTCMFLSCLFGLAFAGIQNLVRRFKSRSASNTFPFGPAISLAFLITLFAT